MEKIWFTSDTHFGHKNILKFCPESRPCSSIEEHDQKLIENWQRLVAPNDRVYHLGDFFFCNAVRARSILAQLPGKIHLIYGNHDKVISSNYDIRTKFESISDYKEIYLDKIKICLFHFPIWEWHRIQHGSFHLYGHVHNSVKLPGRAMDVGIDTRTDMNLWSWEEIKKLLEKNEIRAHHDKFHLE